MLEVAKVLEDFNAGRITLSPAFVEELKQCSSDSVIITVPDINGRTRMLTMTRNRANELYRSVSDELNRYKNNE